MSTSPFVLTNSRSLSPLLLTCEHASKALPPGLSSRGRERRVLDTHEGHDIGALAVARELARRLGASLVAARWSRLLVDLNRPVGDPELIRSEAGGISVPWNRGLDSTEMERRVREHHAPYHAEIDRQIARRLLRGVRPLLVSVHTFTPRLGRSIRRFDLGLLYVDDRSLAWRLGRRLREKGLSVRFNEPYSGPEGLMYAVHRHGSHHGLPCVEVEINQALLGSERGTGRVLAALAGALRPELSKFGPAS